MPTIQIWAKEEDMETLRRLKNFLEYEQEKIFERKAWLMGTATYRRGKRRRKRIRRERINNSLVYRNALNWYWIKKEKQVIRFEKKRKV